MYGDGSEISLNDYNFRMAFAVENYNTHDLKIDPAYVKWIFRMYGSKDDVYFEKLIPYHICTDEDYSQFY